ncbi:MAG: Acyl-CoA dehydrogenase [uncultured Frankineae bacterium]|uniref:Acyl-CoA dehydrogenase n=1 Tax=uncultured Frankineae bacterium TaxID=437475 RepID=A0A6J4LGB8_9ACTN|nr:MAG: Acyl-CoA dehydrogenase [uncultured Frankineae bacterium]
MVADEPRVVAVVGAGTIGLSWATLFAAHGLEVRVQDPRPDLEQAVGAAVRQLAATLPGGAQDPEVLLSRIVVVPDLEQAVAGADVVQENGPERIELKRELFARMESAARPDALVLSSTSGIMPSDMARDMAHPERLLVGHPFNPPHVVPLVEVVPGERTSPEAVAAAVEFYRRLGKQPVVVRKEMPGFVANRLQSALFRESVHLVLSGVVSPEDLDTIVTSSIGTRWATAGPFESFDLGGGPGGLRHLLEHLGPGMARRWKDLGQPELTPETVELLSSATEQRFAGQAYEQRTAERDRRQRAVLAALAEPEPEPDPELQPEGGVTASPALPRLLGDFYGYEHLLSQPDQEVLLRTREWLEREVRPIANDHWARSEFPHHLIPQIAELGIVGLGYPRADRPAASRLLTGFLSAEFSRVDTSMATFLGVHSGLAMGSVVLCGSPEQQARWLPDMFALRKIGAFALTERDGGSDVAGGMTTTARRDGDAWVLNGAKRWIGNGTFADLVVVWARDEADGQVKGFVVEKGTPGFTATKMEGKLTLRTVQNADIVLTDCRVPEADRLQRADSFRDTSRVLRLTRGGVAWNAVGCMMGAYEVAVAYAGARRQFGHPIGRFQLIQDHLVTMLGDITSSLGMAVQVARLQDADACLDEQAALAKLVCTVRLREAVARGRELFGGNGMLLEYDIVRYWNDAEALYSYEGTREINTLIVGRAITGLQAFV